MTSPREKKKHPQLSACCFYGEAERKDSPTPSGSVLKFTEEEEEETKLFAAKMQNLPAAFRDPQVFLVLFSNWELPP